MALITREISQLYDGAGNVAILSYTYDDVDLRLTKVRVVNGLTSSVFIKLIRTNNQREYGPYEIPANTTQEQSFPGAGANRFGITIDARGRIDGAEVQFYN